MLQAGWMDIGGKASQEKNEINVDLICTTVWGALLQITYCRDQNGPGEARFFDGVIQRYG